MWLFAVGICLAAIGGARFIIEAEKGWKTWVTISWVVLFFVVVAVITAKSLPL